MHGQHTYALRSVGPCLHSFADGIVANSGMPKDSVCKRCGFLANAVLRVPTAQVPEHAAAKHSPRPCKEPKLIEDKRRPRNQSYFLKYPGFTQVSDMDIVVSLDEYLCTSFQPRVSFLSENDFFAHHSPFTPLRVVYYSPKSIFL